MEFKHPQYYKNLRKLARLRNRDQAISSDTATAASERAPGTGPKPRYTPTGILLGVDLGDKPQAASSKRQASSKPEPVQVQASSAKRQASQPE